VSLKISCLSCVFPTSNSWIFFESSSPHTGLHPRSRASCRFYTRCLDGVPRLRVRGRQRGERASATQGLLLLWSAPSGDTTCFCLASFPRESVRRLGSRCSAVEGARHNKVSIWNKTVATRRQAIYHTKAERREDTKESVLQLPPLFFTLLSG
jgi:hypothetical protein